MKKLLNKKGFTLMEMLIVVAIIVILVAVSVPVFSGSLNRANAAVDAANLRAAKAAGIAKALANDTGSLDGKYYYNIAAGTLGDTPDASINAPTEAAYKGSCSEHKDSYILVEITGRTATATWYTGANAETATCPQ